MTTEPQNREQLTIVAEVERGLSAGYIETRLMLSRLRGELLPLLRDINDQEFSKMVEKQTAVAISESTRIQDMQLNDTDKLEARQKFDADLSSLHEVIAEKLTLRDDGSAQNILKLFSLFKKLLLHKLSESPQMLFKNTAGPVEVSDAFKYELERLSTIAGKDDQLTSLATQIEASVLALLSNDQLTPNDVIDEEYYLDKTQEELALVQEESFKGVAQPIMDRLRRVIEGWTPEFKLEVAIAGFQKQVSALKQAVGTGGNLNPNLTRSLLEEAKRYRDHAVHLDEELKEVNGDETVEELKTTFVSLLAEYNQCVQNLEGRLNGTARVNAGNFIPIESRRDPSALDALDAATVPLSSLIQLVRSWLERQQLNSTEKNFFRDDVDKLVAALQANDEGEGTKDEDYDQAIEILRDVLALNDSDGNAYVTLDDLELVPALKAALTNDRVLADVRAGDEDELDLDDEPLEAVVEGYNIDLSLSEAEADQWLASEQLADRAAIQRLLGSLVRLSPGRDRLQVLANETGNSDYPQRLGRFIELVKQATADLADPEPQVLRTDRSLRELRLLANRLPAFNPVIRGTAEDVGLATQICDILESMRNTFVPLKLDIQRKQIDAAWRASGGAEDDSTEVQLSDADKDLIARLASEEIGRAFEAYRLPPTDKALKNVAIGLAAVGAGALSLSARIGGILAAWQAGDVVDANNDQIKPLPEPAPIAAPGPEAFTDDILPEGSITADSPEGQVLKVAVPSTGGSFSQSTMNSLAQDLDTAAPSTSASELAPTDKPEVVRNVGEYAGSEAPGVVARSDDAERSVVADSPKGKILETTIPQTGGSISEALMRSAAQNPELLSAWGVTESVNAVIGPQEAKDDLRDTLLKEKIAVILKDHGIRPSLGLRTDVRGQYAFELVSEADHGRRPTYTLKVYSVNRKNGNRDGEILGYTPIDWAGFLAEHTYTIKRPVDPKDSPEIVTGGDVD